MTRFAVLNDERGLIIGLDKNNAILEKGMVYELKKIMGQIILVKIGKNTHGKIEDGLFGYGLDMNSTINQCMGRLLMSEEEIESIKTEEEYE